MSSRIALLLVVCAALPFTAACDKVIPNGQTVTLANRSVFTGASTASPDRQAVPGVTVGLDSTVVVQDADAFGGSVFPGPTERNSNPGAAGIQISEEGTALVMLGTIQGGSVIYQQPSSVGTQQGFAGPGINYNDSDVEIRGGSIVGGAVMQFQPGQQQGIPGSGLRGVNSNTIVSGGTISVGAQQASPSPSFQAFAANLFGGTFDVSGGTFNGKVQTVNTRSVIRGGSIPVLELSDPMWLQGSNGCSEIRGGSVRTVRLISNERLFIFGTGFNVPLGTLAAASPTRVTGTSASGTPIDTTIVRVNGSSGPSLGTITIAAPGAVGCP